MFEREHIQMHWSIRLRSMGKRKPVPLRKETRRLMRELKRKWKLERLRKKLRVP